MKTRAVILALTVLAGSALTACDTYPSGCVRIPTHEVPGPYAWDDETLAVWWFENGDQIFVGVAGDFPIDGAPTWHGASHFNGGANYAEYLSALRCYQTNGASSWPWW